MTPRLNNDYAGDYWSDTHEVQRDLRRMALTDPGFKVPSECLDCPECTLDYSYVAGLGAYCPDPGRPGTDRRIDPREDRPEWCPMEQGRARRCLVPAR